MKPMERPATFAAQFYPGRPEECAQMAEDLLRDVQAPPAVGAIAPHAGWVYSGATAALAIRALAQLEPETVIVFGAAHGPDHHAGALFPAGVWHTPVGDFEIDDDLAGHLLHCDLIAAAPESHIREHSIEVQLPLLKRLVPEARLVPMNVRPGPHAVEVGQYCAQAATDAGRRVVFLGTTDLTHYGPAFGFEPQGRGSEGIRWAKEVNDRRFVEKVRAMDAEGAQAEALENHNACGPGAVAATIAAMRACGVEEYVELAHTTSAEVKAAEEPHPLNSVGYEAGVFVRA